MTTTGPDATHPPTIYQNLGGGVTTTGPDATHPPQLSVKTWGGGGDYNRS